MTPRASKEVEGKACIFCLVPNLHKLTPKVPLFFPLSLSFDNLTMTARRLSVSGTVLSFPEARNRTPHSARLVSAESMPNERFAVTKKEIEPFLDGRD